MVPSHRALSNDESGVSVVRKINKRERDLIELFRALTRQQKDDVMRILAALRAARHWEERSLASPGLC